MEDDGLYLPEIRTHSLEKLRRHNFYAAIFSKAMARKWRHRVYIGLYAGAGRAIIRGTREIVETSALAVVRQEVPFTKYIFVDSDPQCTTALADRVASLDDDFDVTLLQLPVNDAVPERFAIQKFDEAMARLGFRPRDMRDTVPVKVTGMGVYLYSLALYTRHELGEQFWKTTVARTDPQFDLGI
jgi:hypothetical protein